jgi:hypothetical protein
MAETLVNVVIERHRRRLRGRRCRRIRLDFDPTDDPIHGQQDFTLFHGYDDTYCYLPLIGEMTFNEEKEQYLISATLPPGNSAAALPGTSTSAWQVPLPVKYPELPAIA